MKLPLQITFRDMEPSPAVETRIQEKAEKLDRFFGDIMGCRVVVESPHGRHHKGKRFHVRIDATVPEGELVVSGGRHHDDRSHEDVYVAVRDAFAALQRQLEDRVRKSRGFVKAHEEPAYGRVLGLLPAEDYGKIETPDGRVIYFHRNSVLDGGFGQLEVGTEVFFHEEQGEQGPQASTVRVAGKHHVVG
ncbi:MAG: HPF/RaiA family ribosome-associated protein [Gammaproteobacteria bacterium]|nr:HPF/RaiA family ribosome-associated protein [Gammaproteobacteria bacterium]